MTTMCAWCTSAADLAAALRFASHSAHAGPREVWRRLQRRSRGSANAPLLSVARVPTGVPGASIRA